jgi:hypothetical protein
MRKKIAVIALMFVFLPMVASAQTPSSTTPAKINPCSWQSVKGQTDTSTTLPRCVNQVYVWSLGIAVLLAMLMIVLGGYYLMTSGGNAEQATKGKEYITSALIGVVLLFCAYLLLKEINPDLVNFKLDSLKDLNK